MKFRFLMSAMLAGAFCATPAWAAWHGSANQQEAVPDKTAAPKVTSYNITLSILSSTVSTSGACIGGTGLMNFCPSGICTCYTFAGTASGSAGNGPVMFYETFDDGNARGHVVTMSPDAPLHTARSISQVQRTPRRSDS